MAYTGAAQHSSGIFAGPGGGIFRGLAGDVKKTSLATSRAKSASAAKAAQVTTIYNTCAGTLGLTYVQLVQLMQTDSGVNAWVNACVAAGLAGASPPAPPPAVTAAASKLSGKGGATTPAGAAGGIMGFLSKLTTTQKAIGGLAIAGAIGAAVFMGGSGGGHSGGGGA